MPGRNNGQPKGFPGTGFPVQGMSQLSNAGKEVAKLVQVRERGKEDRPIVCKCGNRIFLRHEFVEAIYTKWPKMLGLPEEQFPEEEIGYRVLKEVYVCIKCKEEVCSRKLNNLLKVKEDNSGKEGSDRKEASGKHPKGSKKE